MAVPTKQGVPSIIQSGDTVIFTETLDGYPASAWNADLLLTRNGSPLATAFRATSSGDDYVFTLTSADTTDLAPGYANYYVRVTEIATSQIETAVSGQLFIKADPSAAITKTDSMLALEEGRTKFRQLMAGEFSSTSFNGQSFTSRNLHEFQQALDRLQAIVNAELRQLGLSTAGGIRRIVTRFNG